jgi:hypothetical protein
MQDISPNPLTKAFPLAVGVFGWQVHGVITGIVLVVAYVVIVIASNSQVISSGSDDWIRKIEKRKWIIFTLFMIGIAISGMQVVGA